MTLHSAMERPSRRTATTAAAKLTQLVDVRQKKGVQANSHDLSSEPNNVIRVSEACGRLVVCLSLALLIAVRSCADGFFACCEQSRHSGDAENRQHERGFGSVGLHAQNMHPCSFVRQERRDATATLAS